MQDGFQNERVAVLSCGHRLHEIYIAQMVRNAEGQEPHCPLRCGVFPTAGIRINILTNISDADRWYGEVNPCELDQLRVVIGMGGTLHADDERTLQAGNAADARRQGFCF